MIIRTRYIKECRDILWQSLIHTVQLVMELGLHCQSKYALKAITWLTLLGFSYRYRRHIHWYIIIVSINVHRLNFGEMHLADCILKYQQLVKLMVDRGPKFYTDMRNCDVDFTNRLPTYPCNYLTLNQNYMILFIHPCSNRSKKNISCILLQQ